MFVGIRHIPRKDLTQHKYVEVKDECFVARVRRKSPCDTHSALVYACIEAYSDRNRSVTTNLYKCFHYIYKKFGVNPEYILECMEAHEIRSPSSLPMKTIYLPLIKKYIVPKLMRKRR